MNIEITEEEMELLEDVCNSHEKICWRLALDANAYKLLKIQKKLQKRKTMTYKQQFKDAMKKYWPVYLFVIFFAYSLIHTYKCPADEYRNAHIDHFERTNIYCFENQVEMGILNDFPRMNAEYDSCDTYTKKRDFHKRNAERCMNDAKNMCWYFPPKMRDKSLFAFGNVAALASLKDLKSKFVAALVITLIEYGADAYEEWTNINTKLHWAEYHYDQYEFFCEVVKAGNLRLK